MRKKSIVYLLASILAFSPMTAFADTYQGEAPAEPVAVEEQADMIQSDALYNSDPLIYTHWNDDRTICYKDATMTEKATGLFKAPTKADPNFISLYYADADGTVRYNLNVFSVVAGISKFTWSNVTGKVGWTEDASLKNSVVYYYMPPRANGDCYIENTSQIINNQFFLKDNGTLKLDEGIIQYGGRSYMVMNGGPIFNGTGIMPCAGKSYFVDNGIVYTTPGLRAGFLVGDGGAIVTAPGFVTLSTGLYYIQAGGAIASNAAFSVGKNTYHAAADGRIIVGLHKWGKYYYVSDGSGAVVVKKGLCSLFGERFYVQKGGKLKTNKKFKVKKSYYISDKTGLIQKGFFIWKKNLYYASSSGKLRTKAGFFTVNGQRYYSRKDGKIWRNKSFKVKGKTYRAYGDGTIATYRYLWNNKYYYADKNGALRTKEGFFTYNGKKYYSKSGGALASKEFVKSDDKYYYIGEGGALVLTKFTYQGMTFTPDPTTGEISKQDYIRVFPDAG